MKLIYSEGIIVEQADWIPDNFTGIVEYANGSKSYSVNGLLHRDGGLPAHYNRIGWHPSYWVSGNMTGQFFG